MKRGRPKSTKYAKDRRHSVILTDLAELIFREVNKKRGDSKWFHRYISEHLVNDFGQGNVAHLLAELKEKVSVRDRLEIEMQIIAAKIEQAKLGDALQKEKSRLGRPEEVVIEQ